MALPEKVPREIYVSCAAQLGWQPALIRALAMQETWEADEDPRWPRLELSRWKRYRMASREAMKFDRAKNSPDLQTRWLQFAAMDEVCKDDATINPAARPAAILSHSIGFGQILGENHKFAGCDTPEAFWEAMKTMDGQAHCFVAYARSSERLMYVAKRLDTTPRRMKLKGRDHLLKLGDISEISAIWNGANYESNKHDAGIATYLKIAVREGFNVRVA